MSSYRGAWDGGPPGAEAEYGPPQPAPPAAPLAPAAPHTDPWTGVCYSHYAPAPVGYDYQSYSTNYGYNYDPSYYQRPDAAYGYGKYPDSRPPYPSASHSSQNYDYGQRSGERPRSPVDHRRSYRSKSRSTSPYVKRDNAYSKRRDSYDEERRHRSRSKSKRQNYSSSDSSSSGSRSPSRITIKKEKSSRSLTPDRSYNKKSRSGVYSTTPPKKSKNRSYSRSRSRSRTPSVKRSPSRSPRLKEKVSSKSKGHSIKDTKNKEASTSQRKSNDDTPPSKGQRDRSSLTPPKSYKKSTKSSTPSKRSKYKAPSPRTPPRRARDTSLTPPKCYAQSRSSMSSKSRSRSGTPRLKRKHLLSPTSDRSRSRSMSSGSSKSSRISRAKPKRKEKLSSRSRSRSGGRSKNKSKAPGKSRGRRSESSDESKSRSPSKSASHSPSRSPSDDERRGQFTVADRKRYWKRHKSRQEERQKDMSPPKELKPPPGAVESTTVDDIQYGVPPEVEGPNFAELLHSVNQMPVPSSSKSKGVPLAIKNDGSFLEMFKKMQEATQKVEEKPAEIKKPVLPFIGKRRGGRVLKTGLVKKAKAIDEQTVSNAPTDAWSLYMQEVKKYRETSCEEERKTRPLVK